MLPEPENSGTNFFESFSDLIFATMAIFVLLFVVILILVRPPNSGTVKPMALDVVVAIDGSGSMSKPMVDLRAALTEISTRISPVATNFRVGIVVYRSSQNSEQFPNNPAGAPCVDVQDGMAMVYSKSSDNGASLDCLTEFFRVSLQPVGGPANIHYGVKQAIDMLSGLGEVQVLTRTLVIIGDVGPYETDNSSNFFHFPKSEWQQREANLLGLLSQFHSQHPEVKVLSLFSGAPPSGADLNAKSYQFFEAMSKTTDGTFLKSSSDLMLQLLLSVLPEDSA